METLNTRPQGVGVKSFAKKLVLLSRTKILSYKIWSSLKALLYWSNALKIIVTVVELIYMSNASASQSQDNAYSTWQSYNTIISTLWKVIDGGEDYTFLVFSPHKDAYLHTPRSNFFENFDKKHYLTINMINNITKM